MHRLLLTYVPINGLELENFSPIYEICYGVNSWTAEMQNATAAASS
jgi:hypothetical protein